MKKLLFLSILFVQLLAHAAGGIEGGGGKAVVCTDASNNVTSVELLDLWEARTLFSQNPDKTIVSGGIADGVGKLMQSLKQSHPYQSVLFGFDKKVICENQDCVAYFMQDFVDLFLQPQPLRVIRLHGVKLELTDDSYEVAQPDGNCDIRQVVNYGLGDESKIYIDQDLLDKMDNLNQAALIAHEAYYSFLRQIDGETNSIRTRRAVGYAISGQPFMPVEDEVSLPAGTLDCTDTNEPGSIAQTEIYFYPNPADANSYTMWVQRFGGTPVLGIGIGQFTYRALGGFNPATSTSCSFDNSLLMGATTNFSGPVEFDQALKLRWACGAGKVSLYVNQHQAGSDAANTQLYCKPLQQQTVYGSAPDLGK